MDLNHLLHRHQVSLMRARVAQCVEARRSHLSLARAYAGEIDRLQRETGGGPLALAAI